jgi:hypothetical protein
MFEKESRVGIWQKIKCFFGFHELECMEVVNYHHPGIYGVGDVHEHYSIHKCKYCNERKTKCDINQRE